MKKILSILLLVTIFTITTKANMSNIVDSLSKTSKKSVTYIDTSSNFKMIYTDIKSNIQALSSALKVGAEHVYGILVKQQIVNSITWTIYLILCVIVTIFVIKFNKWLWLVDTPTNRYDDRFISGVSLVLSVVSVIVMFAIGICKLDIIVTGFVNPEYLAIKEIINFVK